MGEAPVPYFVRTAGRGDLEAIRALLVETWHATYDHIYGAQRVTEITDSWHAFPRLEGRLQQPDCEFLVADSGAQLGGMAFASAVDEGKTVKLWQLYVRPACQGQGIGAALLAEIEDCFPEARQMRLEVEGANLPAIDFYRAHGFAPIGTSEDCGGAGTGIPSRIYEKPLRR